MVSRVGQTENMSSPVTDLLVVPAERPGDRIRRARLKARLTTRELGARIGVDHSRISQWERYYDDPSPDSAYYDRIAAACAVPSSWLRTGTTYPSGSGVSSG